MGDSSFASGFKTGFGSAFLQFAFERLADFGSFAWKEIGLVLGIEDELRKFQRTFLKIQDLVDHVESSPLRFSGGSKAWQTWFEDLRKLAYDADALLDHVSLNLSTYCTKHSVDSHQENQVRPMIFSSLQLDLPHEISKMQNKLDDLANEMKSLLKIEKVKMDIHKHKTGQISYSAAAYSSTSLLAVDDGVIVGRQQDKDNVVKLLDEKYDEVSVVPLVGMGGVGKTTLARFIFNNQKACKNYKLKIWVSVSEDFDVVRITKSMIESATQRTCQLLELDLLQRELHQILINSGKFLLVLDDYWNENLNDWELLSLPFRSIFNGSKVIVTTRSKTVSKIVGSTEAYNLQVLSDDDCWRLMKQRAFFKREDKEELELLGIEIAKKCKGLPLAAKTLGSVLLHHHSTEDEWSSILKSDLWDLPQYENSVFPCLMLSYLHLPAHLQKCFAYCSIFPQNHEFEVEELVHLWMAEGFIQPQGERRLEDIGSDYFDDLHSRSFFIQGKSSPNQITYKMHDLIHDLARLVSASTCFRMKHDTGHSYPLFGTAFHLSLHHNSAELLELKATLKNERLRTFLVLCKSGVTRGLIDHELFFNLKYLRVLDLSNIGLDALPDSIDHLIYLRYLNLSGNRLQKLPRSMCKLVALQTLKLRNCPELLFLPSDMKNFSNLRHLIFDVGGRLSTMPPELGRLTNLQTLSAFVVRRHKGHGIQELNKMDSLRGSLSIKNIDNVSNEADATNAKLEMKPYLNKLVLQWEELRNGLDPQVQNQTMQLQARVFTNLKPHKNLKELEIRNYSGIICPDWLSDSARKFTTIHLHGLGYCRTLPSLGQLPLLKSLQIGEMNALQSVDHNFYGDGNAVKFPSLESLEVYQMPELAQWMASYASSCMPCLTTLRIDDCPNLTSLPPNLQSLPNSNISRCPRLY